MVHQVSQHPGRYPGVGQGLGVGVAEGVRMNGPPVKRNRLTGLAGSAGVEAGDAGHPGPHPHQDLMGRQVGPPVGVLVRPGQQPQRLARGVGEALGHPGLLGADRLDQRRVGQRQPPAHPGRLVVVIDQHRLGVLVKAEAVQVQAGDLADPPPGALEQQVGEHRRLPGAFRENPEAVMAGSSGGSRHGPQPV